MACSLITWLLVLLAVDGFIGEERRQQPTLQKPFSKDHDTAPNRINKKGRFTSGSLKGTGQLAVTKPGNLTSGSATAFRYITHENEEVVTGGNGLHGDGNLETVISSEYDRFENIPGNPHLRPGLGHKSTNKQAPPLSDSLEGTFLWAVGVFGTVGNGALVLTALCSPRMRKPLHILIGTLAITDLFVSVVYIPSYTYFLLQSNLENPVDAIRLQAARNFTGVSFCSISRNLFIEMASVTLTLKALIAMNLYALACSRDTASFIFSLRRTIVYVVLAWVINFLVLFLPDILGYAAVDFYPDHLICGSDGTVWKAVSRNFVRYSGDAGSATQMYSLIALSIHMIELCVILGCFMKVHRAITRGKSVYWQHQNENANQAKMQYSSATTTTWLVFASFCLCWLPIYIVNIVDPTHTILPRLAHHFAMDLLLLKSAINPAIYIHGFRSVRIEIKLLCMCRCRGRQQHLKDCGKTSSSSVQSDDKVSMDTSCVKVRL